MLRVYCVRHGETIHNVDKRIQGPLLDDPLNERGRAQAAALERRFANERSRDALRLAAVYASPMKRAWETAEAVARGAASPPPVPTPALIEFSWGKYLGQVESGETIAAMKRMHELWTTGHVDAAVEGGGESPASAFQRAWAGLRPTIQRHALANETIAWVAHGRILKVILAQLVKHDLAHMEDFPQGNTGVTIIEHDGGEPWDANWRVVLLNDLTHLPDPKAARGDALV